MRGRRFPTAEETERVAEVLESRPRSAGAIARELGMTTGHAAGSLESLLHQRRAVRISGQGWSCRRRSA